VGLPAELEILFGSSQRFAKEIVSECNKVRKPETELSLAAHHSPTA
jgi:hypothetical protein